MAVIACLILGFYEATNRRYAIIRNNRNYFVENIQPNNELISSLLSMKCITKEKSLFIQRHRLMRNKNDALLYAMKSFDEMKFSNFVRCLRRSNQKTVAKIIEKGG